MATALLAAPVVVSVLAPEDVASASSERQASYVKRERLVDNGRTKVTEFVDELTGHVEYCTAGDPRSKVIVTEGGENGGYEIRVRPHDPTTDAGVERMAEQLTERDIRTRQTACGPREQQR